MGTLAAFVSAFATLGIPQVVVINYNHLDIYKRREMAATLSSFYSIWSILLITIATFFFFYTNFGKTVPFIIKIIVPFTIFFSFYQTLYFLFLKSASRLKG